MKRAIAFIEDNIWKFGYFIYPYARRFVLRSGLIKHTRRQPFRIGWIGGKIDDVKKHLKKEGYEDDPLAWVDPGEFISMRIRINRKSQPDKEGKFQYHIRVFNDGEVKAHYEYAPEGNPLYHYYEHIFRPRRNYFRKLLKNFL